jgi:hypothetical protein
MGNPASRVAHWVARIKALRARYRSFHGRVPSLLRPRRYTEKMQWRKLFDPNPQFTVFCDKLATRDFIVASIGPQYLSELLWSGAANAIPFAALTPPYVLKASHASGKILMVYPGEVIDEKAILVTAQAWLEHCYSEESGEPGYKNIPRKILAEKTIITAEGGPPDERRFFVFDGKTAIINTVFPEDGRVRNGAFHTVDWQLLDWYFSRRVEREFPVPLRLAEMSRLAEQLGAGFDHVRVDFYDCGAEFFIGEITVYSWSGLSPFKPDEADFLLGKFWRLRAPLRRALAAILSGNV